MTCYYDTERILVEARLDRKLSLRQLAEKTGISKSMLSDVENGNRRLSMEGWQKLARVFGWKLTEVEMKKIGTEPRRYATVKCALPRVAK